MGDAFPSADELRRRAAQSAEAEERETNRRRRENVRLVREFVEKMSAAGLIPGDGVFRFPGPASSSIRLQADPLAFLEDDYVDLGPYDGVLRVERPVPLEEFTYITWWEPRELQSVLLQLMPR